MWFFRVLKILSLLLVLFFSASCVDRKSSVPPLKVVCLGDSITFGYKLADPVHQSFPGQIDKQAQGHWKILNCGVNGATVLAKGDIPISSQKAYERALKAKSDVIILMLGTNDTKHHNFQFRDEFVGDYVNLVKTLQGIPSHPYIIACSIPPILKNYPNGLTTEREQEINKMIRKAVTATEVDFLDIYTALSKNRAYFIDGVHPNASGAKVIATLVYNKIVTLQIHHK